ncbi:MAG: serine/threonine-protein kinase, partial [Candidatus Bathyarchaeia archaeon]
HILHRDVKPSNILLTEDGQPLLTDFGIAKILEAEEGQTLTGTGVGIGTPEYMSPEQGLGKGVGPQADVYSLGVVLYEMITGRKPYTADTPMAVVLKHVSEALPRPRMYVPELPEGVERVLLKALAKQPEDRYASMEAFAEALANSLAEEKSGQTTLPDKTFDFASSDNVPIGQVALAKLPGNGQILPTDNIPSTSSPVSQSLYRSSLQLGNSAKILVLGVMILILGSLLVIFIFLLLLLLS